MDGARTPITLANKIQKITKFSEWTKTKIRVTMNSKNIVFVSSCYMIYEITIQHDYQNTRAWDKRKITLHEQQRNSALSFVIFMVTKIYSRMYNFVSFHRMMTHFELYL